MDGLRFTHQTAHRPACGPSPRRANVGRWYKVAATVSHLVCKAHLHQLIDDLTIGANANKLNRQKPVEHERAKIKFLARIIKRDYPVTSNMGNRIGGIEKISV